MKVLGLAPDTDLAGALQDFMGHHALQGSSIETVKYYLENVSRFIRHQEVQDLAGWTQKALQGYLLSVVTNGRSVQTILNYRRALSAVTRWFHNNGYIPENTIERVAKPRNTREKPNPFTPDDIHKLLLQAKKRRYPIRAQAVILTFLDTGIRLGELITLKLQDVDWTQGYLTVTGKTGERVVPIGKPTLRTLKRYVDLERKVTRPQERHVFVTHQGLPFEQRAMSRYIRRIAIDAGITGKKLGPHTFRHTFAYTFLQAGGNLFHLKDILGHTTLSMTEQYVKNNKSDLRHARQQHSPVNILTRKR